MNLPQEVANEIATINDQFSKLNSSARISASLSKHSDLTIQLTDFNGDERIIMCSQTKHFNPAVDDEVRNHFNSLFTLMGTKISSVNLEVKKMAEALR